MQLTENRKGFTLLELLAALSIMAVGLLAAASMQGVAVNANSVSNRVSVASALAQQVAEDLLSTSTTGTILTTTGGPFTYMLDRANGSNNITIPGSGTFSASYWITDPAVITVATGTSSHNVTLVGTTQVVVKVYYISQTAHGTNTAATTFTTYKRVL